MHNAGRFDKNHFPLSLNRVEPGFMTPIKRYIATRPPVEFSCRKQPLLALLHPENGKHQPKTPEIPIFSPERTL